MEDEKDMVEPDRGGEDEGWFGLRGCALLINVDRWC